MSVRAGHLLALAFASKQQSRLPLVPSVAAPLIVGVALNVRDDLRRSSLKSRLFGLLFAHSALIEPGAVGATSASAALGLKKGWEAREGRTNRGTCGFQNAASPIMDDRGRTAGGADGLARVLCSGPRPLERKTSDFD